MSIKKIAFHCFSGPLQGVAVLFSITICLMSYVMYAANELTASVPYFEEVH
jgi:hypothetical protein